MVEIENRFLLPVLHPEIAWHRAIVFVDFAISLFPVVEFASAHTDPLDDLLGRHLGSIRPIVGVIDDRVSGVVRNPGSL